MKNIFIVCFTIIWVTFGCAVNSHKNDTASNTTKSTTAELKEKDADSNQTLAKGQLKNKKEILQLADTCPPGQLMATKIVTGETGTKITDECVTPFSRNIVRSLIKVPATVAIK